MSDKRKELTPEELAAAEKAAELTAKEKARQEELAAAEKAAELAAKEKAKQEEVAAAEKAKQNAKSPAEKLVEKYRKSYPDNRVFYVTSDMQVFLQTDKNMALLHQNTLKEGELETINS